MQRACLSAELKRRGGVVFHPNACQRHAVALHQPCHQRSDNGLRLDLSGQGDREILNLQDQINRPEILDGRGKRSLFAIRGFRHSRFLESGIRFD